MTQEIFFTIFFTISWTTSLAMNFSIVYYLKSKPPGLQTQFDLATIETAFISVSFLSEFFLVSLLSLWLPNMHVWTALILCWINHLLNLTFMCSTLLTVLTRSMLISRIQWVLGKNSVFMTNIFSLALCFRIVRFGIFETFQANFGFFDLFRVFL